MSARTERNINAVRDSVARRQEKSLRQRSQEPGTSPEPLRLVLISDLHLYAQKIQTKHKLTDADMKNAQRCVNGFVT